jgi:hypothetical protein
MKILIVEKMKNAGCCNGNYPTYRVEKNGHTLYKGVTCNCGSGCGNTDNIYKEAAEERIEKIESE